MTGDRAVQSQQLDNLLNDTVVAALRHSVSSHHHPACATQMRRGRKCSCHVEKAHKALYCLGV